MGSAGLAMDLLAMVWASHGLGKAGHVFERAGRGLGWLWVGLGIG
jgi:hypothetical protein